MTEIITSRKNSRVAHIKKLGADGAYRKLHGEFLCEGIKLLREAVQWGAEITSVLTCTELDVNLPASVPVYHAAREIIEYASTQKTPQDVLFTCAIPSRDIPFDERGTVIILERVQDPGNVGTVIRTANAFGCRAVLLTDGCADVYNPKTVRATMGAVFRQPVYECTTADIISLKACGRKLYATALREGCRDIRECDLKDSAIVIGSEGSGISEQLLDICDEAMIIPMTGGCESLNAAVASSVCLWEAFRERR